MPQRPPVMINPLNGRVAIRERQSSEHADILIAGDCCPRLIAEERVLDGQAHDILAPLHDIFATADQIGRASCRERV